MTLGYINLSKQAVAAEKRGDAEGWHHWGNECPRGDIGLMPGGVMHIDWASEKENVA